MTDKDDKKIYTLVIQRSFLGSVAQDIAGMVILLGGMVVNHWLIGGQWYIDVFIMILWIMTLSMFKSHKRFYRGNGVGAIKFIKTYDKWSDE